MSQARFAWAAFKNMMRAAARDPLWAFLSLLAAPFRIWQTLEKTVGNDSLGERPEKEI